MKFIDSGLEGAYFIDLTPFKDHRGLFARTYCKREFESIGHTAEFVQANHSQNKVKGTLRGLHFQYPPFSEVKLIRCIKGAVYDVIVDIRKGSNTFMEHVGVVLSAENMRMIYIPDGFAHGFITLEDESELVYQHTNYYTPGHEGAIKYNDPKLRINWPEEIKVISEKDKNIPFLNNNFSGIEL